MKTIASLMLSCCMFSLVACDIHRPKTDDKSKTDSVAAPLPPVTLASVSPSPDFPNASLAIASVKAEAVGNDSTKLTFNFDVKNYELKMQTSDNANKMCNNSDKGQHIHFIMDNGPYKALYEPTNTMTFPNDGEEHYIMAFLSRSYHESIKSKGVAVVYHFKVDEKGKLNKLEDPKTPMIFYSRPKGDYIGKDATNVLLDFYVWNCELSPDGYKVRAEIHNENLDDQKLTTVLNKWEPHFIKNLGMGKCKVTLTLLDKEGKEIEGKETVASREFNLLPQEVSTMAPKTDSVKK